MYTKFALAGFSGIQATDLNKRIHAIVTNRLKKVNGAFSAQVQAEYDKGYAQATALKAKPD